jgi:uncharacterized protein
VTETVLDTGPLVAFVDADEQHHGWAVEQFQRLRPKFITCEPVLTETFFLLSFSTVAVSGLTRLIRDGHIKVPFHLSDEWNGVTELMSRYREVPMSFADACLVRMAEVYEDASILTLDAHFRIYRKNRRQLIPVIHPDAAT